MIDSTTVRAHQHAVCIRHGETEDLGRSCGGLTTKIHAVVDGNGLPIKLSLGPGHYHDSLSAIDLLNDLPEGGMLLADKAHDANRCQVLLFCGLGQFRLFQLCLMGGTTRLRMPLSSDLVRSSLLSPVARLQVSGFPQ